jgi:predicted ATPase
MLIIELMSGAKMTSMGLRAVSPMLVGRHGEMVRLVHALDLAIAEGSVVALVVGDAGVGKTRLVQELASGAGERGFQVCLGRCLDLGGAVWPLAPLREILAALVEQLDGETLDLVMGGARRELARLVPELGGGEAAVLSPLSSEQLCELVTGVFGRLALRAPLMVVIEDLHWADETTRMLFSALARARRVRPLLLVGSFRSDDLHRRHPLLPMLAEVERGRCERVDVTPLDQKATAELIEAIGGTMMDRSEVDAIHRRSGGIPFFLEELVAARRLGVTGLPDSLRDVILARASSLDDTAVRVLGAVAAAGATTAEVLADVCSLDAKLLHATLEVLFASALLVADRDEVRFRHELAREVFYDELIPGERAHLHARIADSLESRRPDRLGEIARHWSAANDTRRSLAMSVAAGRQALGAGAAAEAETHFGRALELWAVVDDAATLTQLDRAGLLVEATTAAKHATHLDRAIELAKQAVDELADVDTMREAGPMGCPSLGRRLLSPRPPGIPRSSFTPTTRSRRPLAKAQTMRALSPWHCRTSTGVDRTLALS